MTAIEGVGGAAAPRFGIRGAARRASEFAVPAGPAAAGPAGAAPEAEAVSLTSVLTLQELGSETEADRHGQDLLTALAELQRALLSGAGDVAAMQHLADLASAVPRAADRRLAAMLSAIVVRVRVELARQQP
jgi:hypothetical protein